MAKYLVSGFVIARQEVETEVEADSSEEAVSKIELDVAFYFDNFDVCAAELDFESDYVEEIKEE